MTWGKFTKRLILSFTVGILLAFAQVAVSHPAEEEEGRGEFREQGELNVSGSLQLPKRKSNRSKGERSLLNSNPGRGSISSRARGLAGYNVTVVRAPISASQPQPSLVNSAARPNLILGLPGVVNPVILPPYVATVIGYASLKIAESKASQDKGVSIQTAVGPEEVSQAGKDGNTMSGFDASSPNNSGGGAGAGQAPANKEVAGQALANKEVAEQNDNNNENKEQALRRQLQAALDQAELNSIIASVLENALKDLDKAITERNEVSKKIDQTKKDLKDAEAKLTEAKGDLKAAEEALAKARKDPGSKNITTGFENLRDGAKTRVTEADSQVKALNTQLTQEQNQLSTAEQAVTVVQQRARESVQVAASAQQQQRFKRGRQFTNRLFGTLNSLSRAFNQFFRPQ